MIVFGWTTTVGLHGAFKWFYLSPLCVGAAGFFVAGCVQLFAYRWIEVYPKERRLVVLKRTPFGGLTRKIHGFDELHRIYAVQTTPTEGGESHSIVLVETSDGSYLDFGNHSIESGGQLAERLHALTGAPVGK